MAFFDEVEELSKKFANWTRHLDSEEATKNSLVLPFLTLLGYDIHDPTEVIPEFTADVGTKKGEKVDYAIMHDGKPAFLVECKLYGSKLNRADVSQLLRYFTVTNTKFGLLTDGSTYRFFSDLEKQNVMDSRPFLEFNTLDYSASDIEELKLFTKANFHIGKCVERAFRLKYVRDIKSRFAEECSSPSDDFVRSIVRPIYEGSLTKKKVSEFRNLVKEAFQEYVYGGDSTPPVSPFPDLAQQECWTPLNVISDVTSKKPPNAIRIIGNDALPIGSWRKVLLEVADWLVREGQLTREELPLNGGKRGWRFINRESHFPNGHNMQKAQKISGDVFVDVHQGAKEVIKYSKRLLTHASISHETVELRFEQED